MKIIIRGLLPVIIILLLIAVFRNCINNRKVEYTTVIKKTPIRTPKQRPDSVLVKFEEGVSEKTKDRVLDEQPGPVTKVIPKIEVYEKKVGSSEVTEAVSELEEQPAVEYAEPNRIRSALVVPNDPYYGYQYGLGMINAPSGWDVERGTSNIVTIAVVDTGVDLTHPDLASKIVQGYDVINRDSNPSDDHGHGTHVAGIASAVTNNGTGVSGTSWGARIMPVKVLSASGYGTDRTVSDGIIYAADHGAKVINLSLGGYGFSQTMQTATNYAYSRGALVCAAAGNDGSTSILYPAGNSNVVGVGALGRDARVAYFSNHNSSVDVTAPGVSILSTYWYNGHAYAYLSGTSMATPFTSGNAALLYSRFPSSSAGTIASLLVSRTVDLGSPGRDDYYGYGRIDIRNSLTGSLAQPPSRRINARISRSRIRRGRRVRIYGRVTPSGSRHLVYIRVRYFGSRRWRTIDRLRTDLNGSFSKTIRPRHSLYVRVTSRNTQSFRVIVRR